MTANLFTLKKAYHQKLLKTLDMLNNPEQDNILERIEIALDVYVQSCSKAGQLWLIPLSQVHLNVVS